jgi:hypothetical protein
LHFFFYLKYNPVYSKKSQQILQTDGSGTGTFTSNITGLSANNTYYVRAYATNSVGTGYGAEVSFSTFPITYFKTYSDGGNGLVETQTYTKM